MRAFAVLLLTIGVFGAFGQRAVASAHGSPAGTVVFHAYWGTYLVDTNGTNHDPHAALTTAGLFYAYTTDDPDYPGRVTFTPTDQLHLR